MRLGLSTFVYQAAGTPVAEGLQGLRDVGFEFVDYTAHESWDVTQMSATEAAEIVRMFDDLGLKSSQMLLVNVKDLASDSADARRTTMDYMKQCGEFQLRLGGRQVLVCTGCGIHDAETLRELTWVHCVTQLRAYADWCADSGLLLELEMSPHVYTIVNDFVKMAKILEDVDRPNVFANVDIGHLSLTREPPKTLDKFASRMIHVHLSETEGLAHTSKIIGTGAVDYAPYLERVAELGIDANCARHEVTPVAGIEMGEPGTDVDDPEHWIRESLSYIRRVLPALEM
jgi:sugar phosphate isomerase/epimerase